MKSTNKARMSCLAHKQQEDTAKARCQREVVRIACHQTPIVRLSGLFPFRPLPPSSGFLLRHLGTSSRQLGLAFPNQTAIVDLLDELGCRVGGGDAASSALSRPANESPSGRHLSGCPSPALCATHLYRMYSAVQPAS